MGAVTSDLGSPLINTDGSTTPTASLLNGGDTVESQADADSTADNDSNSQASALSGTTVGGDSPVINADIKVITDVSFDDFLDFEDAEDVCLSNLFNGLFSGNGNKGDRSYCHTCPSESHYYGYRHAPQVIRHPYYGTYYHAPPYHGPAYHGGYGCPPCYHEQPEYGHHYGCTPHYEHYGGEHE